MKNIHLIPTDKPSRLFYNVGGALLFTNYENHNGVNIYITNDEEIKEGDWLLSKEGIVHNNWGWNFGDKKIILTTDQSLDGVQPIDDEFLKWFVKNPSCEEVDVEEEDYSQKCRECGETVKRGYNCNRGCFMKSGNFILTDKNIKYKIILPIEKPLTKLQIAKNIDAIDIGKEEPKQETLEEAVKRLYPYIDELHLKRAFKQGAKWEQEKSISKEAYKDALNMQKCSNAGYESKIKELQSEIERMYNREDMKNAFDSAREFNSLEGVVDVHIVLPMGGDMSDLQPLHFTFEEWFEQFKKK